MTLKIVITFINCFIGVKARWNEIVYFRSPGLGQVFIIQTIIRRTTTPKLAMSFFIVYNIIVVITSDEQ